ncbi:TetR/AcrR family transcriptional regulator [Caulobacter segnis]|jgi:AcrR family transcriptional regulator|uniref:TetR/AcrR family transcriptional regulator n=1 Tax=Caulobacter segnis TaxID=88688 RepID=A0A2W5X292_9CAUL|nr:TetR/AcrR family transcriptional regulator [Caulobacter segnis]PZR30661.1 MAG: TetR/AcrR family transcriptional regulator [Caulobacter segnis]
MIARLSGSSARPARQARGHARRETLLDAAADIVSHEGLALLTLPLVAQRAGASTGSMYHFFQDRDQLLTALGERHSQALGALIENVLEPTEAEWRAMSPPMVIDRLFGRLFAYISDHRDALEILHESETELARTFQDTLERVLCLRLGEAAGVSVSPVFYAVAYGTVLHATKALPGQYGQIIGALPEVLSAYLITLTAQPSPTER